MAQSNCTQCGYCLPCPAGIPIPEVLELFFRAEAEGADSVREAYERLQHRADACVRCDRCEKVCPQHIGISALMMDMAETFE
jgi:predicted aldo/keto reductase-like oxidoreductase